MQTSRRPNAPLITGLGALIAIALALPLLAPSCSDFQPGQKLFSKGSLIIPMDVCYQYQTDGDRTSYTPSSNCPGAVTENGDVIKAYGLVYQLIRAGVAVYWIIDPAKAALTTPDLTLQFNAGFPVLKYDWSGAAPSVAPNTFNHTVKYLGGPFVIDGSDAAKAAAVFQKYRSTFRPTATTGVNVHVANIAFQASVAKMLAGGWSAGGATPPKLALLNIGSSGSGSKNSEVVIRGYLQRAGLDISEPDPANPTVLLSAGGSATGTHGTIYDRLVMEDFLPSTPGDWTTTNLYRNGYQILWVPHWLAPNSCSDCPPSTSCTCLNKYPAATIQQALRTIGAFGAAGKDVFAECAGLGSFEGVYGNINYGAGVAETHFQTQLPSPLPATLAGALAINTTVSSTPVYQPGHFASPLMQLGDYPFIPHSGAIQNYRTDSRGSPGYINTAGNPGADNTIRLITETNGGGAYDIFTNRPQGSTGHGTFVYLGGHSYSGTDGTFQIGGTRLVLNTLFNLGSGCTESGVACDTGLLGKCGRGVFKCRGDGTTYCAQIEFGSAEVCNGLDDNCNGTVDEIPSTLCYDGPSNSIDPATGNPRGACLRGSRACVGGVVSTTCAGQILPLPEVCNGVDDDCNGLVDEMPPEPCYDGPTSTLDPVTGLPRGACKKGVLACVGGVPSTVCTGQVTPRPDDCSCPECPSGQDLNCDGQIAQCGACTNGATRPCYDGPSGTAGQGICKTGLQTCVDLAWGACRTCSAAEAAQATPPTDCEILPATEVCNNTLDEDCNGINESLALGSPVCGECTSGTSRACYLEPVAGNVTRGVGTCADGAQACVNGKWDPCLNQVKPGLELCNGLDDNCNGTADDNASCGDGFSCQNGVCVFDFCDTIEVGCAEGYDCVSGHCTAASCGAVGICPAGETCSNGACVSPNQGLLCAPPSKPAGGICAGGGCYEAGCAPGQLCLDGSCATDPCADVICPGGTFCRQGDCVQACAFVACAEGQRCDVDGFCVADPCAGKSCAPSQTCVGGSCVADPCAGLGCPGGQACLGGACLDDPCAGILCPVGQCQGGQCFATGSSAGTPAERGTSGCGCGSGGAGTPLALLALLALAPLARRRRRLSPGPAHGGRGAALLGLLLLATATSGCKKTDPFDPASCTAPGVNLTACPGEERCVDPVLDSSHCGSCGRACEAGQACVDGGCFATGSVAPFIQGAAQVSLDRGGLTPVRLDLTGQRFTAGATVRATHLGGTTTYAANVLDAGNLSAFIDLRYAPPETWTFRVVNPDRVISNSRPVPVVVPTPVISDHNPKTAAAGTQVSVQLTGTGFMTDSSCMIGGGTVIEHAVVTRLTGTGLFCDLDLSNLSPGTFQLWVRNPQGSGSPLLSLKKDFVATGNGAPTLTEISPASDQVNTVTVVRAYGTGFDATSRVVFVSHDSATATDREQEQATTLVGPGELFVPSLDLQHCPGTNAVCPLSSATVSYGMKVRNGAATTVELPYAIVNDAPIVNQVPVPSSAFQGDLAPVAITGSNFPVGTVLQYQPPAGAFIDATATSSTATSASGTLDLVGSPPGSRPAGLYQLRLRYTSGTLAGTTSAPVSFTVRSNVAFLNSVSPTSAIQGQSAALPVTLQVSNLRPPASGVRVIFSAQPNVLLATASVNATAISTTLDLTSRDTGAYTLQVVNPNGAQPSSPSPFTITPGAPTITGVACTAVPGQCPTATSAPQQVARVPITLTGTNFAKPDQSGTNGSTVHIFANCTPVLLDIPATPTSPHTTQVTGCTCSGPVPCVPDQVLDPAYNQVTVVSPTRIDVLLDTTTAFVPGTGSASYSLWVWNPGGSPAPQRSNQRLNAFTLTLAPP